MIFFLAFFPQFVQVGGNDETQQLLLLGIMRSCRKRGLRRMNHMHSAM